MIESLIVSRWLNDVIGNQDVWFGQFLVPKAGADKHEEVLNIDLDNAFERREPAWVKNVLKEHFGIDAPIEQTSWTDKKLEFEAPVGYSPKHFDSQFTVYGALLRDYMNGKVEVDFDVVKAQLRQVQDLPKAAVLNAMRGFVDASYEANMGMIPVQAAGVFLSKPDFERLFVGRLYRSVEEFCTFLDELKQARSDVDHPMHRQLTAKQDARY